MKPIPTEICAESVQNENFTFDTLVNRTLELCLPLSQEGEVGEAVAHVKDLKDRLANGLLRIAVLGQFNRGKSSFINTLLQMNILPVSVLPLTSVPTTIAYDEMNRCEIHFADTKDPIIVKGHESILHDTLDLYVTENNNPKNIKFVSRALVYCTSPFLVHGTLLIDTPGFGSTHLHNSKTTFQILSSCDAAFFVLSADLPITDIEVSFLKEIMPIVPKIFFIYNKVDLLNYEELKLTMHFIEKTLNEKLELPFEIKILPISAKYAINGQYSDSVWRQSGFLRVEQEILDFLKKEKYYTLSQVLISKLKDSLTTILSHLQKKYDAINAPISAKQTIIQKYQTCLNMLKNEEKRTLEMAAIEEKAIIDFQASLFMRKGQEIKESMKNLLIKLCNALPSHKRLSIMHLFLNQVLDSSFNRMILSLLTECAKPISNTARVHATELHKIYNEIKTKTLDITIDINSHTEIADSLRISMNPAWEPAEHFHPDPPKTHFLGNLILGDKKIARLIDHYLPQLDLFIEKELSLLSNKLSLEIETAFQKFVKLIQENFHRIRCAVESKKAEQDAQHKEEKVLADIELSHIASIIDQFESVKKDLIDSASLRQR